MADENVVLQNFNFKLAPDGTGFDNVDEKRGLNSKSCNSRKKCKAFQELYSSSNKKNGYIRGFNDDSSWIY